MAVRLEGFRELDAALAELPKATQRNVLRRVLRNAAKPTLAAMEARAPRDTGWTAGSLAISNTLNPANRREQKREGKAFAEVYVGSTRGSAAAFQEFGTEYGTSIRPPRPYLRPAWEDTNGEALSIIQSQLGAEIEKARARRARKAARG